MVQVDLSTEQRRPWKELAPTDAAGIDTIRGITISADAKAYVYGYIRTLSDVYLVEGLERSQTKLGPARSCFRQPGDSSFDVLLIRSLNVGLGAHREIAWLNAARTRKYRGRGNFRHPKQLGDAGTVAYATQCAP